MSNDNKDFMEDRDTWWSLHEDTRRQLERLRDYCKQDNSRAARSYHGGSYRRGEIYDKKLDRMLTFVLMVDLPEDKVTLVNE